MSAVTTQSPDGKTAIWNTRWLNMSPGNTGVETGAFAVLAGYVLDGLGLREGKKSALGDYYSWWYKSVVDSPLWQTDVWGRAPSMLQEKTAAMILRDIHKKSPVQFAGLVAAAPVWEEAVGGAVGDGLQLGEVLSILQTAREDQAIASAAGLMETVKKIEATREEGERAYEAAQRSQSGDVATSSKPILLFVGAGLLISIAIYIYRKRR